jgi:hypothetical protein
MGGRHRGERLFPQAPATLRLGRYAGGLTKGLEGFNDSLVLLSDMKDGIMTGETLR